MKLMKLFVAVLLFSFSLAAFPQPKNDYRDSASTSAFFKEVEKQGFGRRETFDPATKILLVLVLIGASFAGGMYYTRHHHGGAQ